MELHVEAATEREVFADGLAALAELLGFAAEPKPRPERRRVEVADAGDRASLFAGWLEELVFLAESQGFVATTLVELNRGDGGLWATVAGVVDAPPPLIKAVTLHRLLFESAASGYVARVVLDV